MRTTQTTQSSQSWGVLFFGQGQEHLCFYTPLALFVLGYADSQEYVGRWEQAEEVGMIAKITN